MCVSVFHRTWSRWGLFGFLVIVSATLGAVVGLACVYLVDLPEIRDLGHYRPISNTVLYDDEGRAFATFALQRRIVGQFEDYPPVLYDAVLSIEDKNFEKHSGFDVWRMLVAACHDLRSGGNVQGASTLTMQLARNLFLSPERTYSRKIREIMLAIQIERQFTKPQIFTLYANQIYLGDGVYGFATGAEHYFAKSANNLTLAEAALLAALPKAPNNYSPLKNPERTLRRRNFVIDCMVAAGKITPREAAVAKNTPIQVHIHDDPKSLAPYFVEEVRQYLERTYGTEQVHEGGLRVYTTLNIDLQKAANNAVLAGLAAYERRHGWRTRLQNMRSRDSRNNHHDVPEWSSPIEPSTARVRLQQESEAQAALLAIDNATGEVKAMVGGRDFNESKFNRATQALRQVGSSFKPYVYTAAIDQGAEPEDTISDTPATFLTASGPYSPHNYDRKFEGVITLRHALAESRNIPAVRLADRFGIKSVIGYVRRFGISEHIPPYLPIALGAVQLTLLEHTSAFSVFPNDGMRATPFYISKVTTHDGRILEQTYPVVQEVINPRTARTMTSMLRDVVLHGTAIAARPLKNALAGKTGTTNAFTDAWFVGFSPSISCGVWVGFDERKTLGNKETGGRVALPIWMDFMATALPRKGSPRDFPPLSEEADRLRAGPAKSPSTPQLLVKISEGKVATETVDKRNPHHQQSSDGSPEPANRAGTAVEPGFVRAEPGPNDSKTSSAPQIRR